MRRELVIRKCGLIIALAMVLTLAMSNVSFAIKPAEPEIAKKTKDQIIQHQKEEAEFYKNIKKVEKFVVRKKDGTFAINGKLNIENNFVNLIKSNMDKVNELVKQGYLTTDSNLRVYAKSKYVLQGNTDKNKNQYVEYDKFFEDSSNKNINISLGNKTISVSFVNKAYAYSPPVGYYVYWWGWMLSLSEWTTQNIVKAANTGAGAAAVGAVLSGAGIFSSAAAVPLGVISGVLWFGSGAIDWIDYIGGNKGVYIKGFWTGGYYIY